MTEIDFLISNFLCISQQQLRKTILRIAWCYIWQVLLTYLVLWILRNFAEIIICGTARVHKPPVSVTGLKVHRHAHVCVSSWRLWWIPVAVDHRVMLDDRSIRQRNCPHEVHCGTISFSCYPDVLTLSYTENPAQVLISCNLLLLLSRPT